MDLILSRIMMKNRPLLSYGIEQLEVYANSTWHSLDELKVLRDELRIRRTATFPRVRSLRGRVARRVDQLAQLQDLLAECMNEGVFRAWFFGEDETLEVFSEVVIHGSLPLAEYELVQILKQHNVEYGGAYRSDVDTLIIGRGGWEPDSVRRQLDLRTGQTVRVYSQEMCFAFLACGKDPLHGGELLLDYFSEGHQGLVFLKNIGFPWPTTDVFPGLNKLPEVDWPQVGLLSHMGYHVGRNGVRKFIRRKVLVRVYEQDFLPRVNSVDYMEEWGHGKTEVRLSKMAESIASFARNEKRQNSISYIEAIEDHEEDLAWLKHRFYTGNYRFQWPSTNL